MLLPGPMLEPDQDDPTLPKPETHAEVEPPATPVVEATPRPPIDPRRKIAVAAGALAVLAAIGLGLALEGRAIARDEDHLWTLASSTEGTEEDWQRYVAFADALRAGGGVRAMLATELTSVWARAPLAAENVLVARAEAADARGDEDALCTLRAEHPGSRGAARALALLRPRLDGRIAAFRAGRGGGLLPALALAVEAARDDDPCVRIGVIRFVRDAAPDAELDRRFPGTPVSVAGVLAEADADERAHAATQSLAAELSDALGVTLVDAPDARAHLVIEVSSRYRADGLFVTASGVELPGVALEGTVRAFVRPAGGIVPEAPTTTDTFRLALQENRALPMAQARGEAALREVYGGMIDELESALGLRVREQLGLAAPTARTRVGRDCADAEPLPIGRVVHGDTRPLFDDAMGSCSDEREQADVLESCDDCWDEDEPPESREAVYRLVVTERARVAIEATSDDGRLLVVYVRESCLDAASEVACEPATGRISEILDPGVYSVFVDETGGDSGRFDLVVTLHDPDREAAACRTATPIADGVPVHGDTSRGVDDLDSACGGVGSREVAHVIETTAPSRVRCTLDGAHDATLDLREGCIDADDERACIPDLPASILRARVEAGRHFLVVDGETPGEAGAYTLSCEIAPIEGPITVVGDTDVDARELADGATAIADTFAAHDDHHAACGSTDGPDVTYRVHVPAPARLRATPTGQPGTVLSLRASDGSELGCAARAEPLSVDVGPGDYVLVVDSAAAEFGARNVALELTDLAAACRAATPIPLGPSAGATHAGTSTFSGTCGGTGPEAVERFVLAARSHVVVRAHPSFGGALYLRRECADFRTELGCSTSGVVDVTLDAGTYYLFVDGSRPTDAGTFSVDVQATPPA